ncbi:GNAT family N-acetyltransferase [Salisaeta longa]|uniref:GNAT family N-acetyltransferase n=1 Tax=Salisaeta longa TaxID=503170 RepID=UPI0003B6B1AA|nr:GNAT family N-acetyltransferase [Salisaeta longa]
MPLIRPAQSDDLPTVRALFTAYAEALDFTLDFQGFQEELDALPAPYSAPAGTILLGELDGTIAGVVALKPLTVDGAADAACEMKRLYVRPAYRGYGLGRTLGAAIVTAACERGYAAMYLDTVASMHAARAVYRSLGFSRTEAYYHNPLPDVVYMKRSLT